MQSMDYIGLDVHKKKISYGVKDGGGKVHRATHTDLEAAQQTFADHVD